MKIIVSAQGVKRVIEGPYAICGSATDFKTLRDALNRALDIEGQPFCYGWIDVCERTQIAQNQAPEAWA